MTTYRLMDGVSGRPGVGSSGTQPPASVTSTSGGWLLGTQFSVTGQMGWLEGYWHWVPGDGDTTARKFALWNVYASSTQQVVTGSVVTSGTMTAGAFNYVPLPAPIQLAPGTQYVAACGWTVAAGIPVTSNQFDNGNPYGGGIVNGILTGWSAGTGTNAFPYTYALGGQGVFSNALGADPAAAMPNNGSGSDNLWVDVSVSDTAPGGYAGSYRLFPNMADMGNWTLDTANNFTLGMEFSLTSACTINNVWFYSPATVTQLPTAVGVYQVSGTSLVASNMSPSWSGTAGSGWMSAALSGTLNASTSYKVAVLNGAGTPAIWNCAQANYWSTGFGAAGLTAGPITAPSNATADPPGQETYNLGATLTYPNTNAGPYSYGLDIEVTPVPAPVPPAQQFLYQMRQFR